MDDTVTKCGCIKTSSRANAKTSNRVTSLTVFSSKLNRRSPHTTHLQLFHHTSGSFAYLSVFFPILFLSLSLSTVACVIGLCVILAQAMNALVEQHVWSLVCVSILVALLLLAVWAIWTQPQNPTKASFMVRDICRLSKSQHGQVQYPNPRSCSYLMKC